MSELVHPDALDSEIARAATPAEGDLVRRKASALVEVARRAMLSDEELVPYLRKRGDAWRKWGGLLGVAEPGGNPKGHRTADSDRQSDSDYKAVERARKIASVDDDDYERWYAGENPDGLTLTSLMRFVQAEPATTPPPAAGEYCAFVVDPPWPMQKISREVRPNQAAALDYAPMNEDELRGFKLPAKVSTAAHLYLWTTHKFLPLALEMAEGWGFNYQCLLTWRKNVGFTPFSWMYSTEHVVFATRGGLQLLVKGRRLDFDGKVREHSRKPDEFYDLVRDVSPGPRLDVFARVGHAGFDVWGYEAEGFADVA